MKKQTILFIGAGRMAEAIFAGLIKSGGDLRIIVSNRSDEARLQALQEQYGVETSTAWQKHVQEADTIVLAMPPMAHRAVLAELAPHVRGQFVVTVAAGLGLGMLEEMLPAGTPVAWVMPNTAAGIGESISLFALGLSAEAEHREVLQMILRSIGEAQECTEQQIHDLTAVTGSAPAFLYRFAEALELAAMEYGVSQEQARKLVAQMIYGSAAMLKQGTPPDVLRDQVTTPGGATAAGLAVMEARGFDEILKLAVVATNARAREMKDE